MPRQPSVAAPTFISPAPLEQMTLRIRVITPFFGGGYATREIDADNPIRSAAIRGNLRSWWRATAGARFANAETLFENEATVWGSDQRHGQVAIQVRHITSGVTKPSHSWSDVPGGPLRNFARPLNNWPGYALQPFQGQKVGGRLDPEPADGRIGDLFELTLTFPINRRAEVETAVSAWVFYGGIGARTRRGCGGIAAEILFADGSTQPLPAPNIMPSPNTPEDLTILSGARFIYGDIKPDAITAWTTAVKIYQDFRQKPGFARNAGNGNRPGRSRWPEPETLRNIMRQRAPKHGALPHTPGFPRADLGLPIIFHFLDNDRYRPLDRSCDPADSTLEGPNEGKTRFASPVITKAVQVGEGIFKPLVLVLNAPSVCHYGNLKLKYASTTHPVTPAQVTLTSAPPMLTGKSVRETLLDYVRSAWKTTVETMP